jgi:SAM-dependent methyltransferase
MSFLSQLVGQTDIYLIDQIMKGRYSPPGAILDAGAGAGRNLYWFAQSGFLIFGADRDPEAVAALQRNYPEQPADNFQVARVEHLPFSDAFFHHIICCAVLHFAEDPDHFRQMFGELIRVLRPGGTLFIRVATDVGLEEKMIPLGDGRFRMPDGTDRFLATRPLLNELVEEHRLAWLEPFKAVLVDELRSMTALMFRKETG